MVLIRGIGMLWGGEMVYTGTALFWLTLVTNIPANFSGPLFLAERL
jgi:hypothetical protein